MAIPFFWKTIYLFEYFISPSRRGPRCDNCYNGNVDWLHSRSALHLFNGRSSHQWQTILVVICSCCVFKILFEKMINTIKIEKFTGNNSFNLSLKLEKLLITKSICYKFLLKWCLFDLRIREGMPLKEHLDEPNSVLMELPDIDVNYPKNRVIWNETIQRK